MLSVCLFTSCSNRTEEVDHKTSITQADSIWSWIDAGQNVGLSREIRKVNLDKAFRGVKEIEQDSKSLKQLSKIQWSYLRLSDYIQFRKANKQANNLALKLKDSLIIGFTHWDLGEFFSRNGVKDSAFLNFSKAQKVFIGLNDKARVGRLAYDMAAIQSEVKDYTGSEINVIKAIEFLKPLDENLMLFRCYNLLGIVAKDLNEFDKSMEYYSIAEDYLNKSGVQGALKTMLSNNLGVNYHEKKRVSKGRFVF